MKFLKSLDPVAAFEPFEPSESSLRISMARKRVLGQGPFWLLISVLLLVFGGCIYPDLKEYPEPKRTLYLFNFANSTFDADAQVELNRILREEIHSKRDFIIVDEQDQAALGLYGEVTLYRKEGRLYDNLRNPTRYELIVGARIRMRDRDTGQLLLSSEESVSVQYSPREGFPETEMQARQRLLRQLARRIHRSMVAAYRGQYSGTE
ncbi:MAG: hypothetical protein KDK23_02755 [Leptospiraceae bacterium]|nr:hypothetical protein [Leptospiraceae bacterium]